MDHCRAVSWGARRRRPPALGASAAASAVGAGLAWSRAHPGHGQLGQIDQGVEALPVLSHADPVTAGAVSGALSTMQQVRNSIGVTAIGVLFFDAVAHGYGAAFERSAAAMLVLLVGVAALIAAPQGATRS